MPTHGSHRPGRARISASGSSTDRFATHKWSPKLFEQVTWTCYSSLEVLGMFHLIESADRRYASLHWVLRASSPASTVLSSATTSYRPSRRTSFPSLGDTSVALVVSLLDGRVHRRGLELVTRFSIRELLRKLAGAPKFLGNHCSFAHVPIRRRQDCLHQTLYSAAAWPLVIERQRLPRRGFRRSIAWLSNSLSTLRSESYPAPRKTRFQLLVRLYWTGLSPARFR